MSKKDFIRSKLSIMKKDNQESFNHFIEPLQDMADANEINKTIEIPAEGNWFNISFKAVQIKEDRLVIKAKRINNGLRSSSYNSAEKEFVVEFQGTRAAYIRGYYKPKHPMGGWPYIWWDVRSYAKDPINPNIRIYVNGFRANNEIRQLIVAMEGAYGTRNIVNSYINDNLLRFQTGVNAKKTPQQIVKEWSQGLMESLGYNYVEAFDTGFPKGQWRDVKVHWCKKEYDLRN